ncbi:MAG: AAA family ATPase, partial [Deltaproteobacteria bacterium]|nr:AAA family ATPase [Deltaproteobacteria bacterium]
MRIVSLSLEAFGPFTGEAIDLSEGREGLHVVLGRNEAGKSSAMRALRDLLFGVPERTTDVFLHRPQDLRVGGRLRLAGGAEIEFRRRKGRKETLLDPDGRAIPDADLVPFLCGMDRASFCRVFSMDHGELRDGGEAILADRGDVGESLFAAGMGVASLRRVLAGLADEAEKLFAKRGQNQSVNAAIARFKEAREKEKEIRLGSDAWKEVSE